MLVEQFPNEIIIFFVLFLEKYGPKNQIQKKFFFFCNGVELHFYCKFGPKIKIVFLKRNLVARQIQIYAELDSDVCFSRFRLETFDKVGSKDQKFLFQIKFGTYTNSNKFDMSNMFIRITLFGQFYFKNLKPNLRMLSSMVMFNFPGLDLKYPFWAKKDQNGLFRVNLVTRLVRLC